MANGMEDLREKNKAKVQEEKHYDQWRTFQGREDAEMLLEKNSTWFASKNRTGERDSWGEED